MAIRVLLICSLAVRLLVVFLGGQYFNPDEARYSWALEMPAKGLSVITSHPGHPLFYVAAFPVVLLHSAVAALLQRPKDTLLWIPASFNALVSTAILGLIYGITLRAFRNQRTATIAAALAAASTPLLYYCRHLLPYDVALALGLLAVYLALDARANWYKSLSAGLALGCSAMIYNGTVLMCLAALGLAAWILRSRWPLVLLMSGAALIPIALVRILAGPAYWAALRAFSGAVVQGWFSEGARLPWVYLWSTDHGLLLLLLAGVVLSFFTEGRPYAWTAIGIYLLLIIGSVGLHLWVVNARMSRTLVPFFCIAAAAGFTFAAGKLPTNRLTYIGALFWCAIAMQSAINFYPILAQQFPLEINREIGRMTPVSQMLTSVGSCASVDAPPVTGRLVLLNSQYLWPVECYTPVPSGEILYQTANPLQWLPYQLEGFSPQQRSLLQRADISIRLIQR